MLNLAQNNVTSQILQRIEERLTRIETKLHCLDGVNIAPKGQDNQPRTKLVINAGKVEVAPPQLTKTGYDRIAKIWDFFGKDSWFNTDTAAQVLDLTSKDIRNLIYLTRNTDGWEVVDKDMPNTVQKLYKIARVSA